MAYISDCQSLTTCHMVHMPGSSKKEEKRKIEIKLQMKKLKLRQQKIKIWRGKKEGEKGTERSSIATYCETPATCCKVQLLKAQKKGRKEKVEKMKRHRKKVMYDRMTTTD